MKEEDVVLLAQLYHAMDDILSKIEQFVRAKDFENLEKAKRELLSLQQKAGRILAQ